LQNKNFQNRSTFGDDMNYCMALFLTHSLQVQVYMCCENTNQRTTCLRSLTTSDTATSAVYSPMSKQCQSQQRELTEIMNWQAVGIEDGTTGVDPYGTLGDLSPPIRRTLSRMPPYLRSNSSNLTETFSPCSIFL